ncbi:dUTP diphosphatase [Paenibacillus sp. VCA1]|uniref:dUTP diphosphatase n=1 Tax=Paenibacillus sp. VCA1 TaxID=3039148 RepID=UPI0028722A6E|nr:dUTP diphosphatase [Paenibacillus sp. VCA1]MDR9852928.1 dUTP diphosphatase [Paenibacillus sp. VCA1]
MSEIPVKIKRLHPDAVIPQYAKPGDSGFDLVAVEDVIIAPGETALVPTGLAFEIPEGFEMQVRPRSGISLRTKLRVANSPGTVDAGFRGEVAVIVDNIAQKSYSVCEDEIYEDATFCFTLIDGEATLGEPDNYDGDEAITANTYWIRKGDKIAQGVIAPVIRATFEVVEELTETERGSGGFGHTGVTAEVVAENVRKAFDVLPTKEEAAENVRKAFASLPTMAEVIGE